MSKIRQLFLVLGVAFLSARGEDGHRPTRERPGDRLHSGVIDLWLQAQHQMGRNSG